MRGARVRHPWGEDRKRGNRRRLPLPWATIRRTSSGYPSAGCSSAEPASVSPDGIYGRLLNHTGQAMRVRSLCRRPVAEGHGDSWTGGQPPDPEVFEAWEVLWLVVHGVGKHGNVARCRGVRRPRCLQGSQAAGNCRRARTAPCVRITGPGTETQCAQGYPRRRR